MIFAPLKMAQFISLSLSLPSAKSGEKGLGRTAQPSADRSQAERAATGADRGASSSACFAERLGTARK
jgi:hypothetical protein